MFAGLFCRSFLDVSFAGLLIYFLRFFCRSLLQVSVVGLLVFFVGLLCRSLFIYVGLFWHLMMCNARQIGLHWVLLEVSVVGLFSYT